MESTKVIWASRILGGLPVVLLLMSAGMKLIGPPGLAEGFAHMGIPLHLAVPLGILEILCTLLYLYPRTSVLGAILLTGYFGGAILTHLRVGDPFYLQFLLGVALWGSLYLRDTRIRALIPLKS